MALPTISPEALAFMEQELKKTKPSISGSSTVGDIFSEDLSNVEMTEDIARDILKALKLLMSSDDASNLTIHDMKDIVSMFKDVGGYIQKSGGNKSSTSGLEAFVQRLKA